MQVIETLAQGLKRELKVTVPASDLEAAVEERLRELCKTVKMKGFRPGKVPLSIVRRHYRPGVLGEVMQRLIEESSRAAIEERALRPALQPEVEIAAFDEGKDLEYTMGIEVLPEIALGDFSDIAVTRLKAAVGEEAVEDALARLAENDKRFEAVEAPRPAAEGDQLLIDFTLALDGEPVEDGGATDFAIELGAESPFSELADGLTGVAPGQERTVTVDFPEDDPRPRFAGRTALFTVKVKALRARVPTVVDDALAERHGVPDVAGLRERIREELGARYERASRARLKRSMLDALDARHRFEVPPGMVAREFDAIWKQIENDAEKAKTDIGTLLEQPEEDARTEFRGIAERRVRLGLLLSEIGRVNGITVEREELLAAALGTASARHPEPRRLAEFYRSRPEALEQFRSPVFEDKVVAFLSEVVALSEEEVDAETLLSDPEEDERHPEAVPAATGESEPAGAEA